MSKGTKRRFSVEFKKQVINEVLSGSKTAMEAAREYALHPTQIYKWTRDFEEGGSKAQAFSQSDRERQSLEAELNRYKQKVGELTLENDLLKKLNQEIERKRRLRESSSSVVTGATLAQFKKPAKR